jgi:hypothetical protein
LLENLLAGGVSAVVRIPQQDSAERAFNKLVRFAAQMETLKRYQRGGLGETVILR